MPGRVPFSLRGDNGCIPQVGLTVRQERVSLSC